MHRLFVAISPPEPIRDQLLDLMEGVSGARWQDEDQLHLTLRFVGEVERHQGRDIAAALGSIHHPRFSIALNGIGSFDKHGKGTLWAGVTPHDQLKLLHKKVNQACLKAGVDPDTRAYHPHITLARLGRGTGRLDAFIAKAGGLASAPFEITCFSLYESELTPAGPVYTIVERYGLDDPR